MQIVLRSIFCVLSGCHMARSFKVTGVDATDIVPILVPAMYPPDQAFCNEKYKEL